MSIEIRVDEVLPSQYLKAGIGPVLHAQGSLVSRHIRVASLRISRFRKPVKLFQEDIFPMIESAPAAERPIQLSGVGEVSGAEEIIPDE